MNGKSFVIFFSLLAIGFSLILIGNDSGWFRGDRPAIFDTHRDFQSAVDAAEAADRILVVDMTASWCPPCKEMDRTVWVNPDLEAYLAENAVVVQIDVDDYPDLAQEFRIEAIPTIIVVDVKRSIELDRRTSLIEAPALIAWLKTVDQARQFLPSAASNPPLSPNPPAEQSSDQSDDQ